MTSAPSDRPWIVALVCGASGVGKSRGAIPLAPRHGITLAEADDIVTAHQALTTPEQAPLLHLWDTDPETRTWTAERIAQHTIAVAEAMSRGFEAVIADHVESLVPVVLEGDYLLPDLAAHFGDAVRAVVVSEPDEDRIVANYLSREPDGGEQRLRARVSTRLDAALCARARHVGVPVVAAWPWADGADRADAALRF